MNWTQLLSRRRVDLHGQIHPFQPEVARSPYERDRDRIGFSAAFRRMHDKTQVFPLPEDDVVHSRLTHSLEVASVGRSLGTLVGRTIETRLPPEVRREIGARDIGDVVAAACLAHDIGNPPFGHAGEDALASFFRETGSGVIEALSTRERADLTNFEGNAQGFRILTRLQHETDGGLHLTAATLAAFCKYPRESGTDWAKPKRADTKKHGCFQQDAEILAAVARETGLIPRVSATGGRAWCRHPLAFLVEAADDICYLILDIEDGVRLGLITPKQADDRLRPIAVRARWFDESRLAAFDDRGAVGYLRAMAIGQMINECADLFLKVEEDLLAGSFVTSLADKIPSSGELEMLKIIARQHCYNAGEVLEIELAGYEALGGLLAHFVPAMVPEPTHRKERPERERKALELLRQRRVVVDDPSLYGRLLRVADYVSGMTDRHALATYRRLKGIAIPGRVG